MKTMATWPGPPWKQEAPPDAINYAFKKYAISLAPVAHKANICWLYVSRENLVDSLVAQSEKSFLRQFVNKL